MFNHYLDIMAGIIIWYSEVLFPTGICISLHPNVSDSGGYNFTANRLELFGTTQPKREVAIMLFSWASTSVKGDGSTLNQYWFKDFSVNQLMTIDCFCMI